MCYLMFQRNELQTYSLLLLKASFFLLVIKCKYLICSWPLCWGCLVTYKMRLLFPSSQWSIDVCHVISHVLNRHLHHPPLLSVSFSRAGEFTYRSDIGSADPTELASVFLGATWGDNAVNFTTKHFMRMSLSIGNMMTIESWYIFWESTHFSTPLGILPLFVLCLLVSLEILQQFGVFFYIFASMW